VIHTKLRGRIQNSKPVARLRIAKASRIEWDAHCALWQQVKIGLIQPVTDSADWDSTKRASLHFSAQSPLSGSDVGSDVGSDTCDASEAIEFAVGKSGNGFASRSIGRA
jgi:hypothetical protein